MARGYCQCLSRCLCITVPPPRIPSPRIFPTYSVTTYFSPTYSVTTYFSPTYSITTYFPPTYSVTTYFPPTYSVTTYPDLHPATTMTTETDELMHDTTCFWSATDSNRIILIIYLARPLTYCGRDIWNCSKVNEPFLS